jgi:FKBP-type peptidyl-prolyl cis-trans isomerase
VVQIKETDNGVKYVEIVKGEGLSPREGDFVIINYTG